MKYSKNFERDYSFYCRLDDKFSFFGGYVLNILIDNLNGKTAKECFYLWDSTGKMHPCKEPELLYSLIKRKKSLNWHIKEWVDGIVSGDFSTREILDYISNYNPPDWIYNAIIRQRNKKLQQIMKSSPSIWWEAS